MDYLSFTLPEDFIKGYAKKKVNWGFPVGGGNSLGELTFISKYSRRKEDGSKEKWHETCRRVIEGYYSILKDHCKQNRTPWNEYKAQASAKDAYDRMFNFKWLPPGRGLWMMGTEFVNGRGNSAALQNCFAGDEKFITAEYGPVAFADVLGETVHVATELGFKEATVQSFGVQPIQRVTFGPAMPNPRGEGYKKSRSNVRVDVQVTPDHRWILADGTETTSLKVDDTVKGLSPRVVNEEFWDAYIHGLIFGDGVKISHRYSNGDFGFELRACDKRTKEIVLAGPTNEIARRFDQVSLTRPSANGDPICSKRSPVDMKELPRNVSASYLAGFLEGWIVADAALASGTILTSQHPDAQSWLEENSAAAGYVLTGVNVDPVTETNFGPRANPCKRFTLRKGDTTFWKVTSIEARDEQPVFCAVVPETGSFALARGIHTGNCAFISTEKLSNHSAAEATLPFTRLMEMSMLGVGVGFDVKGAENLEIHEPSSDTVTVQIEDSREGWYGSVGLLLESFFFKNRRRVEFDYSLVRPAGEPIKGFGGTAAGPSPLMELHDSINKMFNGRAGDRISTVDIADLMNLIGKCVVAGNVRRSAEIALGGFDNEEFVNLKNPSIYPERNGYVVEDDGSLTYQNAGGWSFTSNNSVFADVGMDYKKLADLIVENGEPGVLYLDLCKKYGRLIDPAYAPDAGDYRAAGTNPCGEQTLESFECCTLVETFPTHHDNIDDYIKTLKHAYLYGKAVTLLSTHWPETNEVMQRNRRIGCSMTGVAQFVEKNGWAELRSWMDESYGYIQRRDRKYSEWLGVRESIKTTSIKPSGTVSLLAGVTPGVHWPVAAGTYIRRVRYATSDPLVPYLEDAGFDVEPDVMDPKHTVVVAFPVIGPDVRTERDVTIWEKADLAVAAQQYWADNQVSVTITFQEHEKDQISALLQAKEGQLKSLSMLPLLEVGGAYAQMPYEKIDLARQKDMALKIKKISASVLYGEKAQDAVGEKFCNNDTCEIPF